MSLHRPLRRALGALGLVAVAVAAATAGSTAAPRPAAAIQPIDLPLPSHGDGFAVASRWSDAGESFVASTPAWCGTVRADDDLANEVAQGGPKWHVVLAVPADVAASAQYLAGQNVLLDQAFQSVKTIEAFTQARVGAGNVGQTPYAWSMRFDYGTSCGAAFPDISVYHLPRTQAQYGSQPFSPLTTDLNNSNLYERSNKRYLVHYVGDSEYCGQSYIYSPGDNTGGAKYSITYNLHALIAAGSVGVPCDWTTDFHEMGHSMGAATGGPLVLDGAHTWDCYNDVMSYADVTAQCGDGVLYFDYREDNYFSHSGGWNDTDQSAFWCKPTC